MDAQEQSHREVDQMCIERESERENEKDEIHESINSF